MCRETRAATRPMTAASNNDAYNAPYFRFHKNSSITANGEKPEGIIKSFYLTNVRELLWSPLAELFFKGSGSIYTPASELTVNHQL